MTSELDPLYWHVARWLVAGIFAAALAHKLKSLSAFAAIVRDYELIPPALIPAFARLVVLLEAIVVAGLAGALGVRWAATLAVLLLALYGAGMAVNLARGRRDIDCGCFGPAGDAGRHTLSGWLLARNAVLAVVAAFLFLPVAARALNWLDVTTIAAAAAAGLAAYAAADQLMANAPRLWNRVR